ncbi:flagellar basal body rod protein FlgB [Salibacterium halotolerans]|uniref:Flagellar basal body rod protein FlgB n=1 Tax=Salibacterium halotolerans TaxID=1884432 RepID=A0A1I5MD79_9BACI|nr:flagellar basal body rod protein FlgB [Salibacterium halotolerans]SFP07277.1 flagellar basal-body rod protein FlgB [Salibacterium halotolerans]
MGLFDSATFHNLEQGLKGAATRQKAISDNIANVDTPNYKAKNVHFKHTLNEAVQNDKFQAQQTNQKHIPFGGGSESIYVSRDASTMYNHNGNNVDIDKEMTDSAKNQIYYNALTDRLSSKFSSLKTAVRSN